MPPKRLISGTACLEGGWCLHGRLRGRAVTRIAWLRAVWTRGVDVGHEEQVVSSMTSSQPSRDKRPTNTTAPLMHSAQVASSNFQDAGPAAWRRCGECQDSCRLEVIHPAIAMEAVSRSGLSTTVSMGDQFLVPCDQRSGRRLRAAS